MTLRPNDIQIIFLLTENVCWLEYVYSNMTELLSQKVLIYFL